jgi:hypothetical protein
MLRNECLALGVMRVDDVFVFRSEKCKRPLFAGGRNVSIVHLFRLFVLFPVHS